MLQLQVSDSLSMLHGQQHARSKYTLERFTTVQPSSAAASAAFRLRTAAASCSTTQSSSSRCSTWLPGKRACVDSLVWFRPARENAHRVPLEQAGSSWPWWGL